jgi:hypothetical protein
MTAALLLLGSAPARAGQSELGSDDRTLLETYARDTWNSIAASAEHGDLPDDALRLTDKGWVASGLSSPTDIAAYLWSVVAAEDMHLISREEASQRLARTLIVLSRLERSHGFFFNWYETKTGARAVLWPGGIPLRPFLSSVDNGWLAAALMVVGNTWPEFRKVTDDLLAPMDFQFFYDAYDPANPSVHPGLLYGGYWPDDKTYTGFHYGMLNTEPRIASYIGIARHNLPRDHYFRLIRSAAAQGATTRVYEGVPVIQGAQRYLGLRVVPSWDGTMFEALMVPLFVPEAEWAAQSWGKNHPLYVKAQMEYGLHDARIGYWGHSAAMDPSGGYRAFGVPGISAAFLGGPLPVGPQGVIAPYASFLALPYAPKDALANLRALADHFAVYGPHGFFDSVDVITGRVSTSVLVLDQGMILGALSQMIGGNILRRGFSSGAVEDVIRPLIAQEEFEVGSDPPSYTRPIRSTSWNYEATGFSDPEGLGMLARPASYSSLKPVRRARRLVE